MVDLRKLAVTQISVKDHQLTLVWKTQKGLNMEQINAKIVKDKTWLGKDGDQLGIVQEFKIWPY